MSMASPIAVQQEATHLSPDSVAHEIAQDYSNQWHILEQLKSSVAVVDPLQDTNNHQNTTLAPQNDSKSQTADSTHEEEKTDGKDWYLLPEAASSGHSSETEADSALEISDLRNNADISYNSNNSASSKSNSQNKEYVNKDSLYQEQWHVLEELKASVKAMQWGSDSSLDVSQKHKESNSSPKNGDFVEPHKRTPAGNLSSGSFGSSSSTGSSAQNTLQSKSSHTESPPIGIELFNGTSTTKDLPESKNTSSDLSLESEKVVFAELPNRPATIGNYGASDGSAYPFNAVPLAQQAAFNINMGPNVHSQFNANVSPLVGSPLFFVPEYTSDSMMSKAPMSARERLQPDGRDGPDLMAVPPPGQTVPTLVNYPLSGGSSQNLSGTSSDTLSGRTDFPMPNGTGNVLLAGSDTNQIPNTAATGITFDTVSNNDATTRLDIQAPMNAEFTCDPAASDTSLQNVKEAPPSPLQPNGISCDDTGDSLRNEMPKSKDTSITWLTSRDPSLVLTTEGDGGGSRQSSITHEDLREAVLQRIEAHTQIPGLDGKPSDSSGKDNKSNSESFIIGAHECQIANNTVSRADQVSSSEEATPKELSEDNSNLSRGSSAYFPGQLEVSQGTSRTNLVAPERIVNTSANVAHNLQHTMPAAFPFEQHNSPNTLYSQLSEQPKQNAFHIGQYKARNSNSLYAQVRTPSEMVKPTAIDPFKESVLSISEYEQSPVSKLLGPNFKATQDYLNKLKSDRVNDASVDSNTSLFHSNQGLQMNEHRTSGNYSQVTSLSEGNLKMPKEAWPDHERNYKPTTYNSMRGGELVEEQNLHKNLFQSQGDDCSNLASSNPVSTSFSYLKSNGQYGTDSSGTTNELDSGRSVQSIEQNCKPFNGTMDFSRTNRTSLTDFQLKEVQRRSDLFLKNVNTYSNVPVSSTSAPSVVQGEYRSSEGSLGRSSESFSKRPLARLETGSYVISNGSDDSLPKSKDLPLTEVEASTNVTKLSRVSSYETPLTSFGDKKTWGGEGKNLNLRYSTGSSAVMSHDDAEDTDDLLSYEAALEGDIKYFKNLPEKSQSLNFHSSSINSKTEGLTPSHLTGDISAIIGGADRELPRRIPVSSNSAVSGFMINDEQTKQYHLSLGAGEIRPVETCQNLTGSLEDEQSDGALSSDALEIEDEDQKEEGYSSDRNTTPPTESSCSSLYQPYLPIELRHPRSTEHGSELTGNSSSTFGVYDIRHSCGPGSTNRRRKAMGLSPIPGRVPKPANGIVYVSGDSSPLSMPEDASADEKSKIGRNVVGDTSNDTSKASLETTSTLQNSERSRTSSRSSRNNRHLEGERPRSSSKEGSYRTRSRASSFEEAKLIDDYIGGRKAIPQSKQTKPKTARSRHMSHSDESNSSREFQAKNTDLNQMWERFQESLRSSTHSKSEDSVSSHLSRLSALLSKPIDIIATSSETETEQFRKPRSHSYASSSSDLSTESDQPYHQNYSLTRQIQLRKLLQTVNIADVPIFPRLRNRDTTTTSTTQSDTSASEIPQVQFSSTRSNKTSRKVSKAPSLEPFVKTKPRPADKPKCICAIRSEFDPKAIQYIEERRKPALVQKSQFPQTYDVGVNFPTPKRVPEKKTARSKKGFVDVGVQTKLDSEDDLSIHEQQDNIGKGKHRDKTAANEKPAQAEMEKVVQRRKERHLASQNSPGSSRHRKNSPRNKERHIASQNFTPDATHSSDENLVDESHELLTLSRKERSKAKHRHDRSSNALESKHKSHRSGLDTSGPSWFYPMTNRHYSRPSPNPYVGPSKLRYDEQTVNTYSPPAAPPSTSMQKLSLQDAFFFAKPDFVKRSRARLSRIERNKNLRENGESIATGEDRVSKMEIPANKPKTNMAPQKQTTEKLHPPKPRPISKKEMKTLNLKLYNNLPEVKAKKADDRRASFYKSNRLRAKLFDKRVRESLKKRYAA